MNDDFNLSDDQLQLATKRSLPGGAALDDETQAARETFLALGIAVEASGGDFDEAKLIARLQRSCLNETLSGEKAVVRRPAGLDWWPMLLAGVLAAGVLVAIVRIAIVSLSPSGPEVVSAPKTPQRTKSELPEVMLTAVGWSDPLDDEIALAAATLDQLGGRNRGFDGSLLQMNERLEALSHELSVESL
jgi:hypothetical protein